MEQEKKIGIITCGLETNYGACLQALSTQVIVKSLGYKVELMNYSFFPDKSYSPFKQPTLKSFISSIVFYSKRKKQWKAFKEFRNERMVYSPYRLYSTEDFKRHMDEYSLFIIGSDQVWNPFLGIDIDITLLTFYKSHKGLRKISYASSFGISSLPEELKEKYKNSLYDFDCISTRENTGKTIIKELIDKECDVVVDPVMLQTAYQWGEYEDDSIVPPTPYVLVYDMNHNEEMIKCASLIGERKKTGIIVVSSITILKKNFTNLSGVSPSQFLSLVKNAEYIVTDSFHGTVFSLIYNKEFFAFSDNRSEKLVSRLSNILHLVGLDNRLLTNTSEINNSDVINYDEVNKRIDSLREKSMNYLKTAIDNALS